MLYAYIIQHLNRGLSTETDVKAEVQQLSKHSHLHQSGQQIQLALV